jgi:hypothetical protein
LVKRVKFIYLTKFQVQYPDGIEFYKLVADAEQDAIDTCMTSHEDDPILETMIESLEIMSVEETVVKGKSKSGEVNSQLKRYVHGS